MTLLSIVQNAADILAVTRPSSAVTANDTTARVLLVCAQREGKALSRRWTWAALTKSNTFTSTATEVQTGAIPSDFDRMLADSFFNRTIKRPVRGPLTAQEWETQKALTAAVLFDAYRIYDGELHMYPTPSAGWTYAFGYVSNKWCESSGGTAQAEWAADSDVALLDEELMTLGVIWRFKQSRGLDFAADQMLYEREVMQATQRDGSRRTLMFGEAVDWYAPRVPGVPEGSWSL